MVIGVCKRCTHERFKQVLISRSVGAFLDLDGVCNCHIS